MAHGRNTRFNCTFMELKSRKEGGKVRINGF